MTEPTDAQVVAVLQFAAGAAEAAIDHSRRTLSRQDQADLKKAWGDLHALLGSTWLQTLAEIRDEHDRQMQRARDLERELRRQLEPALKRAESLAAERKENLARRDRIRSLIENPDFKVGRLVSVDSLKEIVDGWR